MKDKKNKKSKRNDMDKKEIIYGINTVSELLKNYPQYGKKLHVLEKDNRRLAKIINRAEKNGITINYIDNYQMDKLVFRGNHQGVALEIKKYEYKNIEKIATEPGKKRIFVLDSITDVGNFASLLRTLLSFGIDLVIIPKDRSVSINSDVHRLSSGASLKIPVARVTNLRDTISKLKKWDYFIYGADMNSDVELQDAEFHHRSVIVLGNEEKGIRELIKRECDLIVKIPASGKIDSLNVAVAGAIFAYQLILEEKKSK